MKLLHIVIGFCLAGLSRASSETAYLFPFDINTQSSSASLSLSSDDAQLLLAQRLSSSNDLSLEGVGENVITTLNRFGGAQKALLGQDGENQRLAKLLIVLEGRHPIPHEDVTKSSGATISISDSHLIAHDDFLYDLLQSDSGSNSFRKLCAYTRAVHHGAGATLRVNLPEAIKCPPKESLLPPTLNDNDFVHPMEHLVALAERGVSSWGASGATAILKISISENLPSDTLTDFIHEVSLHLHALAHSGAQESTLLILPKPSVASPPHPWSLLRARQLPEEPLSSPSEQQSQTSSAPSSRSTNQHLGPLMAKYPICSSSNSTCLNITSSCSSHGHCMLKSQRQSQDSDRLVDCWTCKCTPTYHTNSDGTRKVTYWTGPACQKKDVSMPFWLLAGISIALVSFVSYGIGLMFSVGDTELPSVLGAGVSSVRGNK